MAQREGTSVHSLSWVMPPQTQGRLGCCRYKVPRICFVNKMDRMGANFFRTRDMMQEMLACQPLVMQVGLMAPC